MITGKPFLFTGLLCLTAAFYEGKELDPPRIRPSIIAPVGDLGRGRQLDGSGQSHSGSAGEHLDGKSAVSLNQDTEAERGNGNGSRKNHAG